jgi:hypothetical protein
VLKAATEGAIEGVPEIRYLWLLGVMAFMLLDGQAVCSLSFPVITSLIETVLEPYIADVINGFLTQSNRDHFRSR